MDEEEFKDILGDIKEECNKYGEVLRSFIFSSFTRQCAIDMNLILYKLYIAIQHIFFKHSKIVHIGQLLTD